MTQRFGDGELGQIVWGTRRYQITWDDLLWAGRMVSGESGGSREDAKHVLWCMTQRLAASNNARGSFTRLIQAYSQPINPAWLAEGEFCRVGGRNHDDDSCGSGPLARRQQIQSMTWEQISSEMQDIVVGWARQEVPNGVPKAEEFAVPRVGSQSGGAAGLARRNLQIVHDALGRGPESVEGRGNVFYSSARTRAWPPNYATIVYQGRQSTETTPAPESSTVSTATSTATAESSSEEVFERNFAMTSNRQAPPDRDYQYFILTASAEDPQCSSVLSQQEEQILTKTNHSRFYEQVENLKLQTSLTMTETIPLIEIYAEDENGNVVNLTQEIFSQPSLHNIFEDNAAFNEVSHAEFPERALASIESLDLQVQTPTAGGMAEMTTARLSIMISNPSLVTASHPKGKYLSYMMRQGYHLRIKYGIACEDTEVGKQTAFQWREQGFFISRHTIKVNDNKTVHVEIEMLPSAQKLMNQVLIGESIPVDDIRQITESDINQVLDSITSGGSLTTSQVDEVRRRIQSFANQFNESVDAPSTPGFRVARVDSETNTFGSVLHGALRNSQVLAGRDQITPIVLENSIMALNSIQSLLLTRRYEQILNEDSYRKTINGTTINAVNLGALIYKLVKPEIDSIAAWTSNNNMQIGEINSLDVHASTDQNQVRRNNVQLIFGNFNSQAGNYANMPISIFPMNIDTIFARLRTTRSLGQFSSHINAFFVGVASIVDEEGNYSVERRNGETQRPFERPQIKYAFYPDPRPERPDNWIFYIYDYKVPLVTFRLLLEEIDRSRILTKEDLMVKLAESNIPWLEMGTEGNFIKTMDANTQADDLLQAHLTIQANRQSVSIRQQEDSECPAGISAEFWDGANLDPSEIIRNTVVMLPLRVRASMFMLSSALLFAPVYIFFPLRQCSGLFIPYTLNHNITSGRATTAMDLNIQTTQANRQFD